MMRSLYVLASTTTVAWVASQLAVYLPAYSRPTGAAFILDLMVTEIATVALWVGGWSWVTYVQQGRTNFAQHVCIAAGVSLLDTVILNFALPWLFFIFGWPWPVDINRIPQTALVTLAVLLHLHWARPSGLKLRLLALWAAGSALALALSAVQTWSEKNDSASMSKLSYAPNIYPPDFLIGPQDDLIHGLNSLWARPWGKEKIQRSMDTGDVGPQRD